MGTLLSWRNAPARKAWPCRQNRSGRPRKAWPCRQIALAGSIDLLEKHGPVDKTALGGLEEHGPVDKSPCSNEPARTSLLALARACSNALARTSLLAVARASSNEPARPCSRLLERAYSLQPVSTNAPTLSLSTLPASIALRRRSLPRYSHD